MPEFSYEPCCRKPSAQSGQLSDTRACPCCSLLRTLSNRSTPMPYHEALVFDFKVGDTEQRAFVKLQFGACYQRFADYIEVKLHMEQLDFGVRGCIHDKSKLGHFIHKLGIQIKPCASLAVQCRGVSARPSISARTFSFQRSKTQYAQVAARNFTVGWQGSKAVGYSADAFGFSPATVEPIHSKQVNMTWTLDMWRDGSSFPTSTPGTSRFRFGPLPRLPLDPKSISYLSQDLDSEAWWLVPPEWLCGRTEIQWSIKVDVYTAHFRGLWPMGHMGSFIYPVTHVESLNFGPLL